MTSRLTLVALLILFAGCASAPPAKKSKATTRPTADASPSANAPNANTDPCAMRLHDLCGPLLLYFATHGELPPKLEDLLAAPSFDIPNDLACPVSKQPYRYTRGGLPTKGTIGHIIIYDATAAHDGQRWAIAVKEPTPGEPLVAKVVSMPDNFFTIKSPKQNP